MLLKYDKSKVQFEHPAKGPHHCSQCVHFNKPARPYDLLKKNCEVVIGLVEKVDWCNRFSAE